MVENTKMSNKDIIERDMLIIRTTLDETINKAYDKYERVHERKYGSTDEKQSLTLETGFTAGYNAALKSLKSLKAENAKLRGIVATGLIYETRQSGRP